MTGDPHPPKQIALPFDDDDDEVPDTPPPDPFPERRTDAPMDVFPERTVDAVPRATTAPPSHDFAISLLALARVRGVGPKTIRLLLDHFGDLRHVWTADAALLGDVLQRARVKESAQITSTLVEDRETLRDDAAQDVRRLRAGGVQVIGRHDPAFPQRLAAVPDAPAWLFVEGDLAALHAPLLGIVGTRRPSALGIQTAERLTAAVCREGFGIVSGLAEGIDASAHRVGLYYQAPQVAVLGTGIDIVFPASTEGLRRRILETGGAVISEYFPGASYSRANFVQRNRIQAALALALSPVESQEQSGTAHTVRFAQQYGRPLFAVQRGEVAEQNELVPLLTAQGYSCFDLAQAQGVKQLIAWLRDVVLPDSWPRARRQVNARWFLHDILRQVDDILDDTPMSPEDVLWLQEQIARRLRGAERRNGQDVL